MRLHPMIRSTFVLLSTLLVACTESPSAPASAIPRPRVVISAGDISVQALPVPSGWYGEGRAISASGTMFANNGRTVPTALYAWSAPYSAPPVLIDVNGTIQSGTSASNDRGDVAGFKAGGIAKGAWVVGAPSTWSFVSTLLGGYAQIGSQAINNNGELTGYGKRVGVSGAAAFRATFTAVPGGTPIELPLPFASSIVGSQGNGVNNTGDVVGYVWENVISGRSTTALMRPVLWRRTSANTWDVILLPNVSPASNAPAVAINDAGQIVGGANSALVRWTPNVSGWTVAPISSAGDGSWPQIDACGRVIGGVIVSGKSRAFVWDGSQTLLPLPAGATITGANDIASDAASGLGAIVGYGKTGTNGSPFPVRWTIPGCP